MKREFEAEVAQFLRDYEVEALGIARKYPALKPGRAIALGRLRATGIKRVKGLMAEFGGEEQKGIAEESKKEGVA